MKARPFLLIAFGVLAACQTYDFEPVPIFTATQYSSEVDLVAKPLPPNIMILLDKSGSMKALVHEGRNVDGSSNPACTNCGPGPTPCPYPCSTRINELREAMREFLTDIREMSPKDPRPLGRFGLTLYPTDRQCALPTRAIHSLIASDDNAPLQAQIDRIRDYIYNEFGPGGREEVEGGTPTAASLEFLRTTIPEFQPENKETNRDNYILLLTDGLPNCNPNPRNECPNPRTHCVCSDTPTDELPVNECRPIVDFCNSQINCLDKTGVVEAIEKLSEQGVKTFVVGFGSDVTGGLANEVLTAMARAGGDLRCRASTDPNCTPYFPAADRSQLVERLREIGDALDSNPCKFSPTARPSAPEFLVVYVDGERIEPGENTYSYNVESNTVDFQGELCSRLEASSHNNPVHVRIAVMQTFD